jgi:hypothetical protein
MRQSALNISNKLPQYALHLGVPVFRCSPAGQAVAPSLAKRTSQNHKRAFRVHPSRGHYCKYLDSWGLFMFHLIYYFCKTKAIF